MGRGPVAGGLDEPEDGRLPGGRQVCQRRQQTVGRHDVLGEVVGADRCEVRVLEHGVGHEGRGGDLDHHAGGAQPVGPCLLGEGLGLLDGGDHRGHDPHLGLGGGLRAGQGLELVVEDVGVPAGGAVGAHAQRGVLLGRVGEEGQRLVGARVEGAHNHLLAGEGGEHLRVGLDLLLDGGLGRLVEEAELGAEQADAHGVGLGGRAGGGTVTDVGEQLDLVTVLGGAVAVEDAHALGQLAGVAQGVLARVEGDGALGAVDEDDVAVGQGVGDGLAGAHDRGNAQGSREDRRVGGGAALGGDEGDDLLRVEQGGVGRGEVACDQHEGLGQARDAGHGGVGEDGDDTVAHVLHVPGALGHVAAQRLEHGAQGAGGLPHGALGHEATLADHGLGGGGEGGVRGHLGRGLQQGAALALGLGSGELKALLHRLGGLGDALALLVQVAGLVEGLDRGLGDSRGHAGDGAGDEARAHADARQRLRGGGGLCGRGHGLLLGGDGVEYSTLCTEACPVVGFPPSGEQRWTHGGREHPLRAG